MPAAPPTNTFVLNLIGATLLLFFVPFLTSIFTLGYNAIFTPDASWVGPILIASNIVFYEWPEKHASLGATMVALSTMFLSFSLYLMFAFVTVPIFRIFGLFAIAGSIISLIGGIKTLRWKMPAGTSN